MTSFIMQHYATRFWTLGLVDWTLWSVWRATLRAGHSKWSQCRRWGSCSSLDWRIEKTAVPISGYDQDMIRIWSGCLNSQGPGFTSNVVSSNLWPSLPWACRWFHHGNLDGPWNSCDLKRLAGFFRCTISYNHIQLQYHDINWLYGLVFFIIQTN